MHGTAQVQQSWVGVHQRLSEFQVALQASERYLITPGSQPETPLDLVLVMNLMPSLVFTQFDVVSVKDIDRAREDGERETKALRLYVANVETAAAGLLTRIQDLEGLLSLCTPS